MQRRTRMAGLMTAGGVALGIGMFETAAGRRLSRRVARVVSSRARYESGRLEGVRYRVAGRHPDPNVEGLVLADRVRSVLGPLEHRIDIPRVHVQVEGHEVLLHGDVSSEKQAEALIERVSAIPGVEKVQSHLHVGLFPGDTRPSEGTKHVAPSAALSKVLMAAHGAGVPEGSEQAAARSVLSAFAAVLPAGERRHVLSHLPADLRALALPDRHRWMQERHVRRVKDFASAALPTYEPAQREAIVESVLGALRDVVPEEAMDVVAVLPAELRNLWKTAIPL